ncbi:MAG: glycosyltransferase family 4 protein [Alphaproteobacteria bacterium]|nr:glycosyltransferase family 4 protein [Alphaproteobacteria bacterium]
MADLTFVVPGSLETRTGGFYYDKRIVEGLRDGGVAVAVLELDGAYPLPGEVDLATDTAQVLAVEGPLVVDGLALAALGPALATRSDIVPLIHHRLALETGLNPGLRNDLDRMERAALMRARRIICTSQTTARDLAGLRLLAEVRVVTPGTDPAPEIRHNERADGPLRLLSVGTLTPRKGHDLLVAALADLTDHDWCLSIVGGRHHDPETAAALAARVEEAGLTDRIALLGSVDHEALAAHYRDADVFVLASRYEGYGMAFAEALSFGLPVIGTKGGAIPEVVPKEAGLLVPPNDGAALKDALERLLTDDILRQRLSEGAAQARENLPDWPAQAALFSHALFAERFP